MAFRDLLLLIGKDTEASNRYALWLANVCGATLTVASSVGTPTLPAAFRSELPSDILDQIREDAEHSARALLDAFSATARQTGVTVETLKLALVTGDVGSEVSHLARYFDATVLQQLDPEETVTSGVIEAVLFGSGRPVLIVPYIHVPPQLRTVLIAWDEGRPAARAVADALPLLKMADHVEIVTVANASGDSPLASETMARHLARHGVKAQAARLVDSEVGIANTLLSRAADVDAGLIVMGGYGHSRLREIVLGGTTRTILQSMTVPVLMAH